MRDMNKIAEKIDKLWSGGKSRTPTPTKQNSTDKMIDTAMTKYSKGKK
ncbi:MAG: hypothetical protein HGA42_20075 [Nostocales cyanobacterium W4_Combined_metabat2_030]|jgi:hypothetical protein|nr:hypothetical protein [Nostocales cyanobacterium W4_Combined_metabat2_030]